MHPSYRIFFILVVLAFTSSLRAQAIPSNDLPFPESKVGKNEKRHSISIRRTFTGVEEATLLQIAENTYPPEIEISQKCKSQSSDKKPRGPRWWCGSFDGVYMPHAVTRGAVEYYLTVTDDFRLNNFARTNNLRMEKTHLTYSAEISHRKKVLILDKVFLDVYEVNLLLSWSQYCGNLCAMSISGKRTMVLTKSGDVLYFSGDGEAQGMIS